MRKISRSLLCAQTAGELTSQAPVEVAVQLGYEKNALRFVRDRIEFETSQLYMPVLHNRSPQKHYISSDGFARAAFSREVQRRDKEGTSIADLTGIIRDAKLIQIFIPAQLGRHSGRKTILSPTGQPVNPDRNSE